MSTETDACNGSSIRALRLASLDDNSHVGSGVALRVDLKFVKADIVPVLNQIRAVNLFASAVCLTGHSRNATS